jgi:large subunit ribosomal protein L25
MDKLILMAEPRTVVGKKVKQLRRDGLVPGVVYGPGLSTGGTIQVSVNRRDFDRFYMAHGHSTLFTIQWSEGQQQVFIREVQLDPVKRTAVHIDFFAPNLRTALVASVQVVLRHPDERHAGILTQIRADIEISALPRDFPQEIIADASHLSNVGDALRVSDLVLPPGVTAVTGADELVAMITAGSVEEPAEEAPEAEEAAAEGETEEASEASEES